MNDRSADSAGALAIGVDLGGQGLKAVLVDGEGKLLAQGIEPVAADSRGLEAVEKKISSLVGSLKDACPESCDPPVLGLGIPGFLQGDSRILRSSPNFPGWEDVSASERFAELLGQPVRVENDANCAVLGERWIGAARACDNLLLITLGTGVGTGALVGGRLLRGARGLGAEGGHIALYPGGRPCGCGLRGCLEAYASGSGLATTAKEAWQEEGNSVPCPAKTALDVFEAEAEAGGPQAEHWASRAIERYCLDLAQGIVGMVHLLAPQVVLLGGGISGAFARIGPPVEEALKKRCIPAFSDSGLSLRPAALGDFSGAYGAAWLALQKSSRG